MTDRARLHNTHLDNCTADWMSQLILLSHSPKCAVQSDHLTTRRRMWLSKYRHSRQSCVNSHNFLQNPHRAAVLDFVCLKYQTLSKMYTAKNVGKSYRHHNYIWHHLRHTQRGGHRKDITTAEWI